MSVRRYVRSYVRNAGRGQLSSEWRHNENDVIIETGAASAVGARRHNENDVTMTIAGLLGYRQSLKKASKNGVTPPELITS